MTKAVGYCRVSTEEQVIEGFSLETQEREIKDYCHKNHIELVTVYIDYGVSAYHNELKDRPQGRFLIQHIYNKDIDCVVAISDDRLFRNVADSFIVNNFASQNNINLVYTRQPHYSQMDKYSSFIMQGLSALMNQGYSMQYADKVKKGLLNKASKGEWVGKSPYGYDLVNSHLQVNEEQGKIIKLIFSMYLDNKGGELICNYLNENEYPAPNGTYWNKNSVLGMLNNEVYTGTTIFNRRAPKGSGKKYNDKSEWLIVENTHTPLVSKEDFEAVQDLMSKRKKQNGNNKIDRTKTSLAPLAGLVFCEHCHSVYTQTTGKSAKRGRIYYYMCGSRRRNGKAVCSNHNIPSELLEKFVLYRMKEILTSDMYREQFEQQLQRELTLLESKKRDIARIKRDINKLTTDKEKLMQLLLENVDNELLKDTYQQKLEKVLEQISMQNDQLKLYESIDISKEEQIIREQFNQSWEEVTYKDFQQLSREQLKIFFNYIIDHITILESTMPTRNNAVVLNISMYLKLNGYAPKYTLSLLKDLPTGELKEKANYYDNNSLPNGGGEGGI